MNYRKALRKKFYKTGRTLILAASVSFAVFFAIFFAAWSLCPSFHILTALTLPFAAGGIMFWVKFGLFTDKVANKCPSSRLVNTKTKKVQQKSNDSIVVYHYSAARYLYRTNAA